MKQVWKRLLSLLLAVTMLAGMLPTVALGAESGKSHYGNQYDTDMVAGMADMAGSEEQAYQVLDELYGAGMVDETGHMIMETFQLNGETVTKDELREKAEAAEDQSELVTLDDETVSWARVSELLNLADAMGVIYEYQKNPVEWDEQRMAALDSLTDYLAGEKTGASVDENGMLGGAKSAEPRAAELGGILKDYTKVEDAATNPYFFKQVKSTGRPPWEEDTSNVRTILRRGNEGAQAFRPWQASLRNQGELLTDGDTFSLKISNDSETTDVYEWTITSSGGITVTGSVGDFSKVTSGTIKPGDEEMHFFGNADGGYNDTNFSRGLAEVKFTPVGDAMPLHGAGADGSVTVPLFVDYNMGSERDDSSPFGPGYSTSPAAGDEVTVKRVVIPSGVTWTGGYVPILVEYSQAVSNEDATIVVNGQTLASAFGTDTYAPRGFSATRIFSNYHFFEYKVPLDSPAEIKVTEISGANAKNGYTATVRVKDNSPHGNYFVGTERPLAGAENAIAGAENPDCILKFNPTKIFWALITTGTYIPREDGNPQLQIRAVFPKAGESVYIKGYGNITVTENMLQVFQDYLLPNLKPVAGDTSKYYFGNMYLTNSEEDYVRFPIYAELEGEEPDRKVVALTSTYTPPATLFYGGKRNDPTTVAFDPDWDKTTDYFAVTEENGVKKYANTCVIKHDEGYSMGLTEGGPVKSGNNEWKYYIVFTVPDPLPLAAENITMSNNWDGWKQEVEGADRYDVTLATLDMENPLPTISYDINREGLEPGQAYCDKASQFHWVSSDPTVATVLETTIQNTAGKDVLQATLVPTGKEGTVTADLQVFNGAAFVEPGTPDSKSLVVSSPKISFHAGDEPFVMTYPLTANRTVSKGEILDAVFTSNMTARNAAAAEDKKYVTQFHLAVYPSDPLGRMARDAAPVYETTVDSTVENTIGSIQIPEGVLTQTTTSGMSGFSYVAKVTAPSVTYPDKTYSTDIKIQVVAPPVEASLDRLMNYSMASGDPLTLGWTLDKLDMENPEREATLTIRKGSDGTVLHEEKLVGDAVQTTGTYTMADGLVVESLLKDTYLVTLVARNSLNDEWSSDSCMVSVYKNDFLRILIDNIDKSDGSYKLSNLDWLTERADDAGRVDLQSESINAFRKSVGLVASISVNHDGTEGDPKYQYSVIDDQIAWNTYMVLTEKHTYNPLRTYFTKNADGSYTKAEVTRANFAEMVKAGLYAGVGEAAGVNYRRSGVYSDINNVGLPSYNPYSDFMLVGNGNGETTITAVHAGTGVKSQVDVTVETAENKLYLFSVTPKQETELFYINGEGKEVTVKTDANGELALLEPAGINSDVNLKTTVDGQTYIGILVKSGLLSGERDATRSLAYPINVCKLGPVSEVSLYAVTPEGRPYANKALTLRGGVYKNGLYCYNTAFSTSKGSDYTGGVEDHVVTTDAKGMVKVYFTENSFLIPDTDGRTEVKADDVFKFVFEVRASGRPTMVVASDNTSVQPGAPQAKRIQIQLPASGSENTPKLFKQTYQYKLDGKELTDNVLYRSEKVGPSAKCPTGVLTSEIIMQNIKTIENTEVGKKPYQVVPADVTLDVRFLDAAGVVAPGQDNVPNAEYKVIENLKQLDTAVVYTYPFSSCAMVTTRMTMNRENLQNETKTGWLETDVVKNIKMQITTNEKPVSDIAIPFQMTNIIDKPDPQENGSLEAVGKEIAASASENMDIGSMFGSLDGGDMLNTGLQLFTGVASGGAASVSMVVAPTLDPTTYKIIVSVTNGDMDDDGGKEEGFSADFTDEESMKAIQNALTGEDDEEEEDSNGSTKVSFNFKGATTALARYKMNDKGEIVWDVIMTGGSFDAKVSIKQEWNFKFFCGPIPAFVDLSAGMSLKAGVALETVFDKNDKSYTEFITTLGIGFQIEAFAGVGIDLTLIAFKLGIFGRVGADITYKLLASEYLSAHPKNGLDGVDQGGQIKISGEIGVRLEIKILFFKYKKDLASKGFEKTFEIGQYDEIVDYWNGVTSSGGIFTATQYANGAVMYSIENEVTGDRSYLTLNGDPEWVGGVVDTDGIAIIQKNANPTSMPTVSPDGQLLVYIDNGTQDDKTISLGYAVRNDQGGYTYKGKVEIPLDGEGKPTLPVEEIASLSVEQDDSGKYYVSWIVQTVKVDMPEKEYTFKTVTDPDTGETTITKTEVVNTEAKELTDGDRAEAYSSAEVYLSTLSALEDGIWSTERLTKNEYVDFGATMAAAGGNYAVAYRQGVGSDITMPYLFNVSDQILVNIPGTEGRKTVVAYNGSKGGPLSMDTAMLADGTVLVTYAVNCSDVEANAAKMRKAKGMEDTEENAPDTSEVFYTLIAPDGTVGNPMRLTNNDYADENTQVTTVKVGDPAAEKFLLAWYGRSQQGGVQVPDVNMVCVDTQGLIDTAMPERLGTAAKVGSTFQLISGTTGSINDLGFMWVAPASNTENDPAFKDHDIVYGAKFYTLDDSGYPAGISGAQRVTSLKGDRKASTMQGYIKDGTFSSVMTVDDYTTETVNADTISDQTGDTVIFTATSVSSLASASFTPSDSATVAVQYDKNSIVPGMEVPIAINLENTGTGKITAATVKLATGDAIAFNDLDLAPGTTVSLQLSHQLPENSVADIDYVVTAMAGSNAIAEEKLENGSGKILLNLPDVEIKNVTLVDSVDGKRYIQMTVANTTAIPLMGTGKAVAVGIYGTPAHEDTPLAEVEISGDDLVMVDNGMYVYRAEIDAQALAALQCTEEQITAAAGELPDADYYAYAKATVLYDDKSEQKESNSVNNEEVVTFRTPLVKADGKATTLSASLDMETPAEMKVNFDLRNNSIKEQEMANVIAEFLDDDGKLLGKAETLKIGDTQEDTEKSYIALTKEQKIARKVTVDASAYAEQIATIKLRTVNAKTKLTLMRNDGTQTEVGTVDGRLGKIFTLPENPVRPGYTFEGWYEDAACTTEFTNAAWTDKDSGKVYAKWTLTNPEITTQPTGVTKAYDGSGEVAVAVTEYTEEGLTYAYQWYKKAAPAVSVDEPGEPTEDELLTSETAKVLSRKNVSDSGTYYCVVTVSDDSDEAESKSNEAVLTISPLVITLTADSVSRPYNTEALTKGTYTASPVFPAGEGVDAVITGSQTDVGSSKNVFTSYELLEGTLAENYTITTANGTLTIEKADYPTEVMKKVYIQTNRSAAKTGQVAVSDFFATVPADAAITAISGTPSSVMDSVSAAEGIISFTSKNPLTTAELTDSYSVTITSKNYKNISATLNFVTVDKLPVVVDGVTVSGLNDQNTRAYDGTAVSYQGTPIATDEEAGAAVTVQGYSYTWFTESDTKLEAAPVNAGRYKLVVAVVDTDETYGGELVIPFAITPKEIAVKPKNLSMTTGGTLPKFELDYVGLIGADTLTSSPEPTFACKKDEVDVDGKIAGNYDITWTNMDGVTFSGDKAANYSITKTATGTLTVSTPSSGGTGGAPIVVDGKTQNVGKVETKDDTTTVLLDEAKLSASIAKAADNSKVEITVTGKTASGAAQLTAKNVEEMAGKDMVLAVNYSGVVYNLPASAIDIKALMAELGANDSSAVTFAVTVTKEKTAELKDATLVGTPVTFTVSATNDGKTATVDKFSAPVTRTIEITKEQAEKVATAVVVEQDGKTRHVPTNVQEKGGKHYAVINSLTNSTYALVSYETAFGDLEGKWFAAQAAELGNRMVINGVGKNTFAGENDITRAEFAAILVRALGLPADGKGDFSDVAANAWYAGAVGTANEYGLVKGSGGKFRPQDKITRQEAMVMITRAAELMGWAGESGSEGAFTDADQVAKWAQDSVDFNTANGLIVGVKNQVLPTAEITRAETVTVLLRLLQKAGLVDVRSKVS